MVVSVLLLGCVFMHCNAAIIPSSTPAADTLTTAAVSPPPGAVSPPKVAVSPPPGAVTPPKAAVTPTPGAVTPPKAAVTPPPGAEVTPPPAAGVTPLPSLEALYPEIFGYQRGPKPGQAPFLSRPFFPKQPATFEEPLKSPAVGPAPLSPFSPQASIATAKVRTSYQNLLNLQGRPNNPRGQYKIQKRIYDLEDPEDDYKPLKLKDQMKIRMALLPLWGETPDVTLARQAVFRSYMDYLRSIGRQHCGECIKDFAEDLVKY